MPRMCNNVWLLNFTTLSLSAYRKPCHQHFLIPGNAGCLPSILIIHSFDVSEYFHSLKTFSPETKKWMTNVPKFNKRRGKLFYQCSRKKDCSETENCFLEETSLLYASLCIWSKTGLWSLSRRFLLLVSGPVPYSWLYLWYIHIANSVSRILALSSKCLPVCLSIK